MKERVFIPFAAFIILMFAMTAAGCYTQVGVKEDDRYFDDYAAEEPADEAMVEEDSSRPDRDYYFDEYGYPRTRIFFGYYYPSYVSLGLGWYDPWYYDPWYASSWYYGSYGGWWGHYPAYYPPYPWYPCCYPQSYGRGGFTTRTFGSTRGMATRTRHDVGSTRGSVTPPGLSRNPMQDPQLPTGMRNAGAGAAGSNRGSAGVTTGTRDGRGSVSGTRAPRGSTGGSSVRGGATRGGSRDGVRTPPRRTPQNVDSATPAPKPPSAGQGSSAPARPAPSATPAPSRPSGGSPDRPRQSGSTRGGGGGR